MEPLLEEDDIVVVDRADCDLKNTHENSIYAVVLYSTPFITLDYWVWDMAKTLSLEVSVAFWDILNVFINCDLLKI